MPSASPRPNTPRVGNISPQPQIVDPRWVAKALSIIILVAALCGYATLCGLFWYGQWQLVLTPSRTLAHTPADVGLSFEDVRFGPDASGQPQLDGWWLPSDLASDPTVLILHGGSGSMAEALPQAKALHDVRLNVLLFDYRGFGRSAGKHPTQALMEADSGAALSYLTTTRHLTTGSIIAYGNGLGASLATHLCEQRHDLAALVLENADGDFESRARRDPRARMVPVGILFHERFPLADRLHTLTTPKLLISWTDSKTPPRDYERAATPKITVELAPAAGSEAIHTALRRFLDTYYFAQSSHNPLQQ